MEAGSGGGGWSREASGKVACKPRPGHKLARQRVWEEYSRQKKQHEERPCRGKSSLHIPGAEEASVFEACERGDKGRPGLNRIRSAEDLRLYPECTRKLQRVLGLFVVVLTW